MKALLSLDLSTTCTGWSVFDMDKRGKESLIAYGTVKPKIKKVDQYTYPKQQMLKMISLSEQILIIIDNYKPHEIVIEEIAGSRQRLGQKVLDGFHFVLIHHIWKYVDILHYYDVTGRNGWRTHLDLKLSEQDKINNKHAKKFNKEIHGRSTRLPVIDAKDLACRYVNAKFMRLSIPKPTHSIMILETPSQWETPTYSFDVQNPKSRLGSKYGVIMKLFILTKLTAFDHWEFIKVFKTLDEARTYALENRIYEHHIFEQTV